MDWLFDIILDLIIDGSFFASESIKVPKFIRYILTILISLFFILVTGVIIWIGFDILKNNVLVGIAFILLGLIFFVLCIKKFIKVYMNKKK